MAVPGLTFTATTRVLSGTPTTAATTALTYTVTDENGSTASDTVTVTVAAQVAVTAPGDQTYTMGPTITALTLPAATGGTGTLTYTLRDGSGNDVDGTDNAVPGLTFNTTARVLSGTPTTAATTALTYTVTDERGSTASDTVTVTVADGVVLNAPNDLTYTMGRPIPALTLPAATGGTGTLTYTLTGPASAALSQAVPGLTFNTTARVLTGTPTTAATTVLTYTVTDERGSTASDTVTVTVAAGVALNAPGDQTYTMGRPIPALTLPAATGGTGTLTYTLRDGTGNDVDTTDNAVPGLIFNTISRVLTGTPTTAATTALTYTVTDEHGSTASDTLTLTVAAQVVLNAPGDQTYTMGRPIPALTLSAATGGTGTLTYTLTGPATRSLERGCTRPDLHGHHPRPVRHTDYGDDHGSDLYRHRRARQHRLGYRDRHRGGAGGGDCPGRPDLYDGPPDSSPDSAGGHRRHRHADLHPAGRQRQ